MNIDQAKAIPIAQILDKLNHKPVRHLNNQSWYFSPFREEKTASFHVHTKRNVWYDFGLGIGGDVIHLVCSYLESQHQSHAVSDALSWLKNIAGYVPVTLSQSELSRPAEKPKLVVKSVKPIHHVALIGYLDKRGIPLKIASKILKEVRIQNLETGKNIFALGLQNEEEGYEVRNSFFKGCVGSKSIAFIRGKEPKPDSLNLFEGFMDYLSIIVQREGMNFKNDTIILNSLSCIKHAKPYIASYDYKVAYTWFDNDVAGNSATKSINEFFRQEVIVHKKMNALYAPYKDLNAWHMHKLGLSG